MTSSVVLAALVVALPIVAGVSAFALDIATRLAVAQGEHAGLDEISNLNRLLTDLLQYRELKLCERCTRTAIDDARTDVDRDIERLDSMHRAAPYAQEDWTALRGAWVRYRTLSRVSLRSNPEPFAPLKQMYVHVSDESNLTYDPDIAGIDIADALTYRLPPAIDDLQRATILAEARTPLGTLERRLLIVGYQAKSQVFLDDTLADLEEAAARRPAETRPLSAALTRISTSLRGSNRAFNAFVRQAMPTWRSADASAANATLRALDSADSAALPILHGIVERRIIAYRRHMWLLLIPGLAGPVAAFLIVLFAASALRHRNNLQFAQRLAAIDAVTSVMSRRQFEATLESQRRYCERERAPLSLIIVDVDHFKRYNDLYGHVSGDVCLRRVAQAAAQCMRNAHDVVARYGGEEFVAILPRTELDDAVQVAERIRDAIYNLAIPHAETTVKRISVSLGVASSIPDARTTNQSLVEEADHWLYNAKNEGRNRVCAAGYVSRARYAHQHPATA